jgi:hypothetical protein
VVVVRGLTLVGVTHRQDFSRELLATGVETVAASVEVAGRRPLLKDMRVTFRTTNGREAQTALANAEYNRGHAGRRPSAGSGHQIRDEMLGDLAVTLICLLSRDARRRTSPCGSGTPMHPKTKPSVSSDLQVPVRAHLPASSNCLQRLQLYESLRLIADASVGHVLNPSGGSASGLRDREHPHDVASALPAPALWLWPTSWYG